MRRFVSRRLRIQAHYDSTHSTLVRKSRANGRRTHTFPCMYTCNGSEGHAEMKAYKNLSAPRDECIATSCGLHLHALSLPSSLQTQLQPPTCGPASQEFDEMQHLYLFSTAPARSSPCVGKRGNAVAARPHSQHKPSHSVKLAIDKHMSSK